MPASGGPKHMELAHAADPAPGAAPDAVRVFFALVPERPVAELFTALARDVARRARGRAVAGHHIHLTLAFLGDVAPAAIPALRRIGDALPHDGGVVVFDTLGSWRASGVAWIAPRELPPQVAALHGALHAALAAAGFPLDTRPFRPHLTLARRCVHPVSRAACAPVRWNVDRLCLIGSELTPEGPVYSELAAWALRRP